jgi:hypothetical protein
MPVPMMIGMVRILAFPRSKSGIFDLTLNKIEHFSKVSAGLSVFVFFQAPRVFDPRPF